MKILTPMDIEFDYKICQNLYNKISKLMGNKCSFKDLVEKSHFYSFYDKEKFVGCIYVVNENEELYLNGFSVRKNHKFNISAIKNVLEFYNCDIFAKTKNKSAEFVLRKSGFLYKKTDSDGIKYYKKER